MKEIVKSKCQRCLLKDGVLCQPKVEIIVKNIFQPKVEDEGPNLNLRLKSKPRVEIQPRRFTNF